MGNDQPQNRDQRNQCQKQRENAQTGDCGVGGPSEEIATHAQALAGPRATARTSRRAIEFSNTVTPKRISANAASAPVCNPSVASANSLAITDGTEQPA